MTKPPSAKAQGYQLLFGGLLPIIVFTVIDEKYGPVYGTIAAMIFGIGEMSYEKIKFGKISKVTFFTNALILGLGLISIIFSDGFWFKMQPAIIEFFFGLFLLGTSLAKKPFLIELTKKQGQFPPHLLPYLNAVNTRTGIFFLIHSGIATWAAISWSTRAWALLKGVGFTASFIIYLFLEILWIRAKIKKGPHQAP